MAEALVGEGELVSMLSQTLGEATARDVLAAALATLGIRRRVMTVAQALDALELIAAQPGIVGMTARFAKSRVHLTALAKRQAG
jgi:plasmid stability protein